MIKLEWLSSRTVWKGECPRCGMGSFYSVIWSQRFSDRTFVDVVECHGGHPFVIFSKIQPDGDRGSVLHAVPVYGNTGVPDWLPPEYQKVYSEMIFCFKCQEYRSAIAMAGIMLDAHINTMMKNPGEKKKPLKERLDILIKNGRIDHDQFADATVTRLSRNEVIHPSDLTTDVTEAEAKDAINAVSSCLERFYKWRTSKALPAPSEQVE